MKSTVTVFVAALACIAAIIACVKAAGTVWALPVFFALCFGFYLVDAAGKLWERRQERRRAVDRRAVDFTRRRVGA